MKSYIAMTFLASTLWNSTPAWAIEDTYPISVDSTLTGETAIVAPASGLVTRSMSENITIKLNMSCFGTNLRGVGNPISPNAVITGNFVMNVAGTDYSFFVKFPGQLVANSGVKSGAVQPMSSGLFGGTNNPLRSAGVFGNTIVLNTNMSGKISVNANGQVTEPPPAMKGVKLKSYQFDQIADCSGSAMFGQIGHSAQSPAYPCGQYMGKTGVLATVFRGMSVASDQTVVDMDFAFPGQTGFCGGYWSPLMIFLDEDRPQFNNLSSFPMGTPGKTYWPEANSKGYFLALDRNGNNRIDQRDELFGQNDGAENGFEVLKNYDDNKDQAIDSKDSIFRKLVLWNDANGDGVSTPPEMAPASKMIKSISLTYQKGHLVPIGRHAEARESSEVLLSSKSGKPRKAKIIDIWIDSEPISK